MGRVLLCLALLVPLASADDPPDGTGEALDDLEEAVARDGDLSGETREALKGLIDALREERARERAQVDAVTRGALESAVQSYLQEARPDAESGAADVLRRFALSGDLRFREEYTDFAGRKDRNRFRVRFRLAASYDWSEQVRMGLRLVTGDADDPNSTHQTFGTVLDRYEISLDRLFLTWRPPCADGVAVTVGKAGLPFARNPIYGELVWDGDVQPEGVLATWARETGGGTRLELALGGVTLLEQGGGEDPYGVVAQAAAKVPLRDALEGLVAVGWTWWSNASPAGGSAVFGDNAGNAALDTTGDGSADAFVSDFAILDVVVAATYRGWTQPLVASAEYFRNVRADIGGDDGWALGLAMGRKGKRGDWWAYYQWQVVRQDAVFSVVSQDDFVSQTNFRGHVFGVKYYVADRAELHLWFLVTRADALSGASDDWDWRIRLDLTFGF